MNAKSDGHYERRRREALAISCLSCGARPGTTCRRHVYGYDYPPDQPKGWREKWRAFWFGVFTPLIHPQRYADSSREL